MMISPVILPGKLALAINGPSELAPEDDQCVLEKTALLEVLDQGSGWLVNVHALSLDKLG
jgi:hypothetical protein